MRGALHLSLFSLIGLAACDPSANGYQGGRGTETQQVAKAAFDIGDYGEAARLYERAASAAPNAVAPQLGLARSYMATGQFTRASNALDQAAKIAPLNAEVEVERGNLALTQKAPDEALSHFQTALRRSPRNLDALIGQGVSLDYLSRHTEAQLSYQRGLKIQPTDFTLLTDLALSQVLSGQIEPGIKLMEEMQRDPARGQTVRANLALAYVLAGRDTEAQRSLAKDLSPQEASRTLSYYRAIRADYRAGKPIGDKVFH